MAAQPEQDIFESEVYQFEVNDPVQGGLGGIDNLPLLQLANRTKNVNGRLAKIESGEVIPGTVAPKDSPTFTGDPKAPTPALGDSDTSIATTKFVQDSVNGILSKDVSGGVNVNLTAIEAGNGIHLYLGALTADISVIVPSTYKKFTARNSTTGPYKLTVKTAAGTGVVVMQGRSIDLFCGGVNVQRAISDYSDMDLSGNATAPTPAVGDKSTKVATTQFVGDASDSAAITYAIIFGG